MSLSLGTAPRDLGPAEGGVPEVSPPSTGPVTPVAPARPEQGLFWLLCVHGRGPDRRCAGGPPGGTLCGISSDRQCNQGWPVRTRPPPHTSILRPPPAGSARRRPPGQAAHLGCPPAHPSPPCARLLSARSTQCQLILDVRPHQEVEKPRPTRLVGLEGCSQGRFCEGSTLAPPPPRASPAPLPGTKSGLCPAPELSPPMTIEGHAASRRLGTTGRRHRGPAGSVHVEALPPSARWTDGPDVPVACNPQAGTTSQRRQ